MEKEYFTKYEVARILGARALQLSMNAPILLSISKDKLEEVNFDPLKIAEIEFGSGVLPITVKRPLPERVEEDYEADDEEDPEIVQELGNEERRAEKEKIKSVEEESADLEKKRTSEETSN